MVSGISTHFQPDEQLCSEGILSPSKLMLLLHQVGGLRMTCKLKPLCRGFLWHL